MSKAAELAALIGSQTALSNRNLIINGAMQVSQRSTSETGLGGNASYPTLDRFRQNTSNTAGRFTMSQAAVTDLPGFANSLKLQCTTADTSIAANELGIIMQRIEGQNLQQLKKGTSSAESVTVSFYVKGNAAATYTAELNDGGNDRQISKTFSVTTSWNRVSLTYPGDTSGTIDDDNTAGLELNIWIHAGSNFTSGTLSTTWTSTTNANRVSSSATSFFDSTSRTLEITGLQLEVGEQATPFEHRSFGEELELCKRYYEELKFDAADYVAIGFAGSTTQTYGCSFYFTEKRAKPSATLPSAGTSDGTMGFTNGVGSYVTQGSQFLSVTQPKQISLYNASSAGFSGMTADTVAGVYNNGTNYLKLDAEL